MAIAMAGAGGNEGAMSSAVDGGSASGSRAISTSARSAGNASDAAPDRLAITLSVMLASILQSIDNTIANVALPRIQGSLSATQDQMAWVLTSYIVAAAIMTPLSGWLAGRIGRKRVFLFSVAGFTIASALCGMAQSLPQIVIARLLQGLCGAALIPMSQATLLDINPPERHAKAMAFWMTGTVIGPVLGPALGGWLTETYNWRWVFYINVPFGILAFLGILTFMQETEPRKSRFDFVGFGALSLGVGALQLLLDRGQHLNWFSSTEVWIEATISALGFYVFAVHLLTTEKRAFVSLGLFKDRNFITGNTFVFVIGFVLFATLALLPPMMQDLLHYPALLTGLVTVPRGIGTMMAMVAIGVLLERVDARLIIATGFGLTALSLWQMTGFYLQMDKSLVAWAGFIQGMGTGFVFLPLAAMTFATLSPRFRNEGTALFSLIRNIGSSIGISVVEVLLTRNTQIMHARLAERLTPYGDAWSTQPPPAVTDLVLLDRSVTEQAAMIAYNNDFKLMMVLALCAIPLAALLRRGARKKKPAEPVAIE